MKFHSALIVVVLHCSPLPALADGLSDLQEAQKKIETLELDAAEAALTKAIEAEPKLADALLARALLRENKENFAGAAEDALRACDLGRDYWALAGKLAQAADDSGIRARVAEGAWKKHSRIADLQVAAESFASGGEFKKSVGFYTLLIEKGKAEDRSEYLMRRGNLKSLAGDHAAGMEDLDASIKLDPRRFRAFQLRGRIRLRTGKTKEGLADYQVALKMNSGEPSSYLIVGLAYFDTGNWKEAISALQRATAFNQAHRYTHLYLYLARCRTGLPANRLRGKRELMGYLESRPKQDDWFARLGSFLIGNLEGEKLLEYARQGSKNAQREQLCEALCYVGQMALIAGDSDKAYATFKKVLETRVGSFMEYGTADMELRRTGKR